MYWEIAFSIEYDFEGQGRIKRSSKRHKGRLKKSYSFKKVKPIKWLTPLSAEANKFNCEPYLNYTLSPTGYKKRTGQFLRVLHVYSIDNFVAF